MIGKVLLFVLSQPQAVKITTCVHSELLKHWGGGRGGRVSTFVNSCKKNT